MKRLYTQSTESSSKGGQKERRTNEEEFLSRVNEQRPFTFSYFGYLCTLFASKCCCCFTKNNTVYQRRYQSLLKLQKAREMLSNEKDIESLIKLSRVVDFLCKVVLTRSQKASVQFFHKYVVRDSHVEKKPDKLNFTDLALWESLD